MSDADDTHTPARRPSRLAGLIAPKGNAARPSETPAPQPEPPRSAPVEPQHAPMPAPAPARPIGTGSKSLTLRIDDPEYERLRARAYASRMTHQGILAAALRRYLDEADKADGAPQR